MSEQPELDPERVVVRDRRRIDPETGAPREPVEAPEAAEPEQDPRVVELTDDLQRVTAEYANYRKRIERDRVVMVELATGGVLSALLPLLDDVDRARQHGDLVGGFKGVGEALEATTAKLGLERYGEPGEAFDPQVHEAVMATDPDPASRVATCSRVLQPGYRVGGRVLRPARVAVSEAGAPADEAPVGAPVPEE